jgi:DnaK suppressor protein
VDPEQIGRLLEAERDRLVAQLGSITAVPRDPMAAVGFGKRVGDGTNEAVERITNVDAARNLGAKLKDVERALAKLAEGTYGLCDSCGAAIPEERLEAIPWAVYCVDCSRSR